MGFFHLLDAVAHGSPSLPPFTIEIIIVALLIILLACPVSWTEYYSFANDDRYLESLSLALKKDEDCVGEASARPKSRSSLPVLKRVSPKCDVPQVLENNTFLFRSIKSTQKNKDKTNNDVAVNNHSICNKLSDETLIRAFQSKGRENDEIDSHTIGEHVVDLGQVGTEPLFDVDAIVNTLVVDCLDVASEDSNVSDGIDISVAFDDHSSLASDGDGEQEDAGRVCCEEDTLPNPKQLIALRRTDEITHLSGILVEKPDEALQAPLCDERDNDFELTALIQDTKLDLNTVRAGPNVRKEHLNGVQEDENVSSESDSTSDDLYLERHHSMNDEDSELGLLQNVVNSPCNFERPLRSLDALQEGVDYQDLENISDEDLESNKQFFLGKFINDEEIRNHARFTRSKRNIFVEEIPMSNETEESENLDTLKESDLKAEDKYVNPKFLIKDFLSVSGVNINGSGNALLEEHNSSGQSLYGNGKSSIFEHDTLSKISEETNSETKERFRQKSFSTFSDFKTNNTVFDDLHANSDAILYDDIFMKRYETILDSTANSHVNRSTKNNPFFSVSSGTTHDFSLSKQIKVESENIKISHKPFRQFSETNVLDVRVPIHIPSANTQDGPIDSQLPVGSLNFKNGVHDSTRKDYIDLSKVSSRSRLIFGFKPHPLPPDKDILPNTDNQDTTRGTENVLGASVGNSIWSFRENVKSRKIIFDKDTFLRRKEGSILDFKTNSESMNNLFEISNTSFSFDSMPNVSSGGSCEKDEASPSCAERSAEDSMPDVSSGGSCEKDEASPSCAERSADDSMPDVSSGGSCEKDEANPSCAERSAEDELDSDNEHTSRGTTKKPSSPKLKSILFKSKSREKSATDNFQNVSGNDLTNRPSVSKSKSKTSKLSRTCKQESTDSNEDPTCSLEDDSHLSSDTTVDYCLDNNAFSKLFHKIARKFKGSSKTGQQTREKGTTVQNKLYVYKANQGVGAYPAEDSLGVDRNVRSLDYFYPELQSDRHSLKGTSKQMDIPASGSATNTNTDLHLASRMEDIDD